MTESRWFAATQIEKMRAEREKDRLQKLKQAAGAVHMSSILE